MHEIWNVSDENLTVNFQRSRSSHRGLAAIRQRLWRDRGPGSFARPIERKFRRPSSAKSGTICSQEFFRLKFWDALPGASKCSPIPSTVDTVSAAEHHAKIDTSRSGFERFSRL